VGDSAGGNLITALTLLCISTQTRLPDGVLLCYPALNLSANIFTPSMLVAIDDQLLPYSFLKMCANLYLGNNQHLSESLSFVSPIIASDEVKISMSLCGGLFYLWGFIGFRFLRNSHRLGLSSERLILSMMILIDLPKGCKD
jgi:acetyl esterase/lipase